MSDQPYWAGPYLNGSRKHVRQGSSTTDEGVTVFDLWPMGSAVLSKSSSTRSHWANWVGQSLHSIHLLKYCSVGWRCSCQQPNHSP
eukprot:scaffold810_cov363-Prasinococcus_capsulatus_cf.AAC.2